MKNMNRSRIEVIWLILSVSWEIVVWLMVFVCICVVYVNTYKEPLNILHKCLSTMGVGGGKSWHWENSQLYYKSSVDLFVPQFNTDQLNQQNRMDPIQMSTFRLI